MTVELLAPAGSWEAMEGAIGAGADAVYAGGRLFGARAYAENLSEDELCRAIDYAHLRKCRFYLTVNTLLKNREIEEQLDPYLLSLYEQGLDAVIVQDLGVFAHIRRRFPDLPIHASTQMAVTGAHGAKILEAAGAARVVTARELTFGELKEIREETSLEIEAFVHGALCYSYSGRCLFSSMLGGRSGNRGRCAQPCRLPYQAGGKSGRLLSPKDICTLELLPKILEAGVYSLKIEGRMKQPDYVAGVVSVYRRYLDDLDKGIRPDPGQLERDKKFLQDLFSRGGFCRGYFQGKPGPSMIAFQDEKKISAHSVKIRKRKEKIKGYLMLSSASRAILELSSGDCTVTVTGETPQKAEKRPTTRERITEQMCKTGDTAFDLEEFLLEMKEELFVPVSQLNDLRRKGIQALEQALLQRYRRPDPDPPGLVKKEQVRPGKGAAGSGKREMSLEASCETLDQWQILEGMEGLKELFLGISLFEEICRREGGGYFRGVSVRRDWSLALPHIVRHRDLDRILRVCGRALSYGCKGFLVRDLESFGLLAERGWAGRCRLDASMYTYNDEAVDFWRGQGVAADMVPLELNEKEIAHRDNSMSSVMVYGYIPLMISAQCVQKNTGRCDRQKKCLTLKDRYKKSFPVQCYCESCYNVIYNSLPYGLPGHKEILQGMGLDRAFLSFTVEDAARTESVAQAFIRAYVQGERIEEEFSFTKGHMKRGVG